MVERPINPDAPEPKHAHHAAVTRLRRKWAMEGFDPEAHLRGATGDGDTLALIGLAEVTRQAIYRAPNREACLPDWIALMDITELGRELRIWR